MVLEPQDIYMEKNQPQLLQHLRWIIALNVKVKTISLLQENVTEYLCNLRLGKEFLDMLKKH